MTQDFAIKINQKMTTKIITLQHYAICWNDFAYYFHNISVCVKNNTSSIVAGGIGLFSDFWYLMYRNFETNVLWNCPKGYLLLLSLWIEIGYYLTCIYTKIIDLLSSCSSSCSLTLELDEVSNSACSPAHTRLRTDRVGYGHTVKTPQLADCCRVEEDTIADL